MGTGFLVADCLAVTCAHVVQAAGSACGQPVSIQPYHSLEDEAISTALVLATGWSPPESDDVAFLQLDGMPEGMEPVVLGSARHCEGHRYTSLGFARLVGNESRRPTDFIGGVVSSSDQRKQRMLELGGDEIDKGLSGSPVLDTQTNRVVGMVSEYKDSKRTRFAWATTTDTLITLAEKTSLLSRYPALQLWPEAYGPRELDLYLGYLIETNQWLQLPDDHEVRLERIYVSLRADEMNATEWKSEQALYLQDLAAIRREMQTTGTADQYTEFDLVRRAIARHPKVLKLTARDWARHFSAPTQGLLSLAEVVERHRHVVILGDPGSGKTTLGKWLVLQYTRALQQRAPRTLVRADQVLPGNEGDILLDLGPARLPIFLRIADYEHARWEKGHDDNHLPLDRFIGQHENKKDLPSALSQEAIQAIAQAYLAQGRALVILDGLDEVSNPDRRKKVMQEVKRFLQVQPVDTAQHAWAGNRLVLTSRIVGYQFDPLTNLPHYTVEAMDGTAIASFCRAWMRHVAEIEDAAVTEQAAKLKDAIFDHAHPGVRVLAGNPLLLTLLAQIYWTHPERRLPATRVALFQETEQVFYQQRERSWDRVSMPPMRLTRALAAVASYIHAHEPTGFTEKGQVRKQLRRVLSDEEQVEVVLNAAHEVSGFLVERGAGIYGFLHRALQEYFAAQHLISQSDQLVERLASLSLDPTWREPVVLAVGLLSQPGHPESYRLHDVFTALLEAPDPAGAFLPRRELLAAAACAECEPKRLPASVGQRIAENLLAFYAERERRGRSPVIRQRIQRAFATLQRSPAAAETEALLCTTVLAPDFERRYAAVDLIVVSEWDSPAIARALVNAWRTYADPAGSMLVALEKIYTRHPQYFTGAWLPMRQPEAAPLWEKARGSQEWQAILRILYLLPDANITPEQVNRDSPLTEYIVARLGQVADPVALQRLRQHLLSLASQPGTAVARDAALALSALGETDWVQACVQAAGEREFLLHPLLAVIAFARAGTRARYLDLDFVSALDLDRDLASALDLDRDYYLARDRDYYLARDLHLAFNHASGHALDLASGHARDLARDLARVCDRDLDDDLACDFDRALAITRAYILEIRQKIQATRQKWIDDAAIVELLDGALVSLQRLQGVLDTLKPLGKAWTALITACTERRSARPASLSDQVERAEIQVTRDELETLVDDLLVSLDDEQREHARTVLMAERHASTMGLAVIERMAELAGIHAADPQRGTQLKWALHAILHDRPDWVSTWIKQANTSEETTPLLDILSGIQRVTPKTLEMMVQTLPETAPWVKKALLHSLSWLVRLERIPQKRQALLQKRLLSWLERETDLVVCSAIIKVMGFWQEKEVCHTLGIRLLDRLNRSTHSINELERAAVYMALARLATCQPELVDLVRASLLRECPQAAALARLSVAEVSRTVKSSVFRNEAERRQEIASSLLVKLAGAISDLTECLTALLDAGTDDDLWDTYHEVLAIAARIHLERCAEHSPELLSDLLKFLLARLQRALDQKDWSVRRMALAAVAACAEVMPTTLQEASLGRLESLLVRGTTDAENFSSRRFALTALSYLRTITPAIVPALLAGCQDSEEVQEDAIAAAGRFQSIEGDFLPSFVPTLIGESDSTAYAVTHLLAALGTSTGGEAAGLHGQIIEALVDALRHPNSQRDVMIAGESEGKREDALYTALLQVAGWTG